MNSPSLPLRYTDAAIALHWLIALAIIGLLAVGKFMVRLELDDPLRFSLTQWHKSLGITVLALSIVRVAWRLTHRAPVLPDSTPAWQARLAGLTHGLLYLLLFALPISGWIHVSASPLNVDTVLFNVITLPHLPPFTELADREAIAEGVSQVHEWAGHLLIVLLLMHIGAALKHHLIDRDTILLRMLPDWRAPNTRRKALAGTAAVVLAVGGLYLAAASSSSRALVAAGDADVRFTATVAGATTEGLFSEAEVSATLNDAQPAASQLSAEVTTASVETDNLQVNGSLEDPDWFSVDQYPTASFVSTAMERPDGGAWQVQGTLTLKGISQPVAFELQEEPEGPGAFATGTFTVNRLDFDVGAGSQPDASTVALEVEIRFRFPLAGPGA